MLEAAFGLWLQLHQKSLSSTELTFPREIFRGYECSAGRDCKDAIHARAYGSLGDLSLLVTLWTK